MILVVGSLGAGKLDYVQGLGYGQQQIAQAIVDSRPVLNDLQELILADPQNWQQLLPILRQKEVVICRELGSGIIPVEPEQVAARRAVGRACILLAQEAEQVVRLICGIPQVIKG